MSDQFLGEIRIMPFNFAPDGWAFCNGQILSISQNTALFSLLGTQYGGNGTSTFALPNLQGNVPMDFGNGAGLTSHIIGETGGETGVTLTQETIPAHDHLLIGDATTATSTSPQNRLLSKPNVNPRLLDEMYNTSTASTPMLAGNVLTAGGGLPHNNLMPYLTLNFCIALTGIFPARS